MKFIFKKSILIYFILTCLFLGAGVMLFETQKKAESPFKVEERILQSVTAFNKHPEQYIHYQLLRDSLIAWNSTLLDYQHIEKIAYSNAKYIFINDILYLTKINTLENGEQHIYALPLLNKAGKLLLYEHDAIKVDNTFHQVIEIRESNSAFAISLSNTEQLFLNYDLDEPVKFKPHPSIIILVGLALLSFICMAATCLHKLYQKYPKLYVWMGLAILTMLLIKFNQVLIPIPFNLEYTELFSPELFSSMGEINSFAVCILSTSILTLVVYSFNVYIKKKELKLSNYSVATKFVAILIQTYLFFHFFLPYIFHLIRDSRLSFEFYDLNRVNLYSFLGLFIISLCLLSMTIIVNNIRRTLVHSKLAIGYKILLIVCFILLNIGLFSSDLGYSNLHLFVFAFIYIALLSLSFVLPFPLDQDRSSIFSIFTIMGFIWYVLVGGICSIFIFQFSRVKEQNVRKELANSFFLTDNLKNEFELSSQLEMLSLKDFQTVGIQKRIAEKATSSFLKYDLKNVSILTLDALQKDSTLANWYHAIVGNNESYQSRLSLQNREYEFLKSIPLDDESIRVLYLSYDIPTDVTSRILNTFDKNQFAPNYSVALFYQQNLVSVTGKEIADHYSTAGLQNEQFSNTYNYSLYKLDGPDEQMVIIRYENNLYFSYLSLLSYSLILFIVNTFSLAVLHRVWSFNRRKTDGLTPFKLKLNIGVVLIVFFTFFVFATITTLFIYYNTQNETTTKINRRKQEILDALQKILDAKQYVNSRDDLTLIRQSIQALVIRPKGELLQTFYYLPNGYTVKQYDNFQLLTPVILQTTPSEHKQSVNFLKELDNENFYTLYYKGQYIGIFSLKVNKNPQSFIYFLNDTLSILFNLYIFLLLLSILLSIFIAQRLTSGFDMLSQQFRNLKLSGNKLIQYNKKDDLTLIVHEYNSMIQHVEAMAVNLANSERESAWRDAAKQVAHEINNPITPIKLNIQYMMKEAEAGKDITPLFLGISPTILEQIDQLSEIAKSFSDFAKMPAPENEKTDIKLLISNVINLIKINNETTVELKTTPDNVIAFTDPKFINIIYFNLIKNAIQAVESIPQAHVIVTIEKNEQMALITIEDNGIGIAADSLEKIFMPTFTTKSSGTGIGLSTTKSMIIALGGSIKVESTEGIGTLFITEIPILN